MHCVSLTAHSFIVFPCYALRYTLSNRAGCMPVMCAELRRESLLCSALSCAHLRCATSAALRSVAFRYAPMCPDAPRCDPLHNSVFRSSPFRCASLLRISLSYVAFRCGVIRCVVLYNTDFRCTGCAASLCLLMPSTVFPCTAALRCVPLRRSVFCCAKLCSALSVR